MSRWTLGCCGASARQHSRRSRSPFCCIQSATLLRGLATVFSAFGCRRRLSRAAIRTQKKRLTRQRMSDARHANTKLVREFIMAALLLRRLILSRLHPKQTIGDNMIEDQTRGADILCSTIIAMSLPQRAPQSLPSRYRSVRPVKRRMNLRLRLLISRHRER